MRGQSHSMDTITKVYASFNHADPDRDNALTDRC